MTEPLHEYVVNALRKLNRSTDLIPVEKATGISRWTLQKIASRNITKSRIQTIQALYDYFKRIEGLEKARAMRKRAA
jgi:DNA-binding phage protein